MSDTPTTVPLRWLAGEAQRIRRERRMKRIEQAIAIVVIVVWAVVLCNWIWAMIH